MENCFELLKIPKYDLFRIMKTLAEMLQDNDYDLSSASLPLLSKSTFDSSYENDIELIKRRKLVEFEAYLESRKRKKKSKNEKKQKGGKKESKKAESDEEDGEGEEDDDDRDRPIKNALVKSNKQLNLKAFEPLLHAFETGLTFSLQKRTLNSTEAKTVMVFFSTLPLLGKPALVALEAYLKPFPVTDLILIVRDGLSPMAANEFLPKLKEKYHIRILQHQFLLVNITHHKLAKPHIRLSPSEKKKFIEEYGLDKGNIPPKIFLNDPMCLYYDFRPGDIVGILNHGRAETYRQVIVPEVPT